MILYPSSVGASPYYLSIERMWRNTDVMFTLHRYVSNKYPCCTIWLNILLTIPGPDWGLFNAHREPGLIDEIRTSTNGNYALGNEYFKEEIANMLKRRVSPGKAGRPAKKCVN